MADDQSLTVQINADTAGATDGMSRVAAALDAIVSKMGPVGAAGATMGSTLTQAHNSAAEAAEKHGNAISILGERLGPVETATNAVARAASTLGLHTAEATERIEGMSEAVDGLGKAALPLLALGAAVLTVAEAFNFLKEGVDEAAKAQVAMASLGTAVADQGGAWGNEAKDGVEKFLDAIERATTYSRGEALEALNSLVSAGMSLADAEKTVAIATDVAAGSHRSLQDVVDKLKEAEAGRGRGLIELDEKLKPLIESHANLSTVLEKLSEDFSGQASAATDTFAGKSEQLRNELAHVGEELGEHLLPMLTTGTEILIGFAEEAESHEPQIAHFFDTLISDAMRAASVLSDLAKMGKFALDSVSGDVASMLADESGAAGAESDFEKRIGVSSTSPTGNWKQHKLSASDIALRRRGGDQSGSIGDTTWEQQQAPAVNASTDNIVSDLIKGAEEKAKALHDQAERDLDATRAQPLQHDVQLGEPRKARAKKSADYDFQPEAAPTFTKDSDADAERTLNDQLKAITEGEAAYQRNVDLATTAQGKQNAEWDLAQKKSDDAQASINLLAAALGEEQTKLGGLTDALPKQERAAVDATSAYNAYGRTLGSDPSKDERNHLAELKTAMEGAKTTVTQTQSEIEKLTGIIDQNNQKLVESVARLDTYKNKLAENDRAEEDYVLKSIDRLNEEYAAQVAEHKKEDDLRATQIRNLATENALYGESLQQQLAYYRQRYANAVAAGQQYTDQAKSDFSKIISLEGDEYKQRLDAQKAFIETAQSLESTFVGDILTKHQSLRDTLKSIFGDIYADFAKMVEQMIVKSALFNGLNSQLEKMFNVGGINGSAGGGIGGIGGVGGGAGGGVGGILNPTQDNPGNNLIIDAGSQTKLALTGSATGLTAPSGTTIFTGAGDASGLAVGPGNMTSGSSLATSLGGGLMGAGIGQAVAGVDGGNSEYASIGGGLGGLLAGGIPGIIGKADPIAGLGLELGGALLGSLFSGGQPTAAKDPDEFEGQTGYGQDVADLQFGQSNANGVYYFPDAAAAKFVASMGVGAGTINQGANQGQQATNSNGTIASSGGVDAAEIWLSQNKSDTSAQLEQMGVSPAQFAQWVSLLGSSATGSGQYAHIAGDPNVGDIEVTGATTGGGTKTTTTALASALQSIITASGSESSTDSPVFSVARSYPNMNIGSLTADGTYNQTAGEVNEPTTQATTPAIGSSTVAQSAGVNVNITLTGDNVIASESAMQDLSEKMAGAMSTALTRYQGGLLIGGIAAMRAARSGNL